MTLKQAIQLWRIIKNAYYLADIYNSDVYAELGIPKDFWHVNNARQVAQNTICDEFIKTN